MPTDDDHQYGDAPIEDAYRKSMEATARALDQVFNGENRGAARKVGFVLMVFEFGDKSGRANYISNGASRADVLKLLKEQAKRFERQAREAKQAAKRAAASRRDQPK